MLIPLGILAAAGAGIAVVDQLVAMGREQSPFMTAYPFSAAGFGTKFADAAVSPGADVKGIDFSPDAADLATASAGSGRLNVHKFSLSGFGTKYANPNPNATAAGFGVVFSPQGNFVAMAHLQGGDANRSTAFGWASGFGTMFSTNQGAAGEGRSIGFTAAGNFLAVGHTTSPRITAYPFSAGYGTKVADPAYVPTSTVNSLSFNQVTNDLAMGIGDSSPFSPVLAFSTGFGSKYADPASLPSGAALSVNFNPLGTELIVGSNLVVHAYAWSNGYGTKRASPANLPFNIRAVRFSRSGQAVGVTHGNDPRVGAFPYNAGFGTKFADPANFGSVNSNSIAFA